jgi:hypothetical protein
VPDGRGPGCCHLVLSARTAGPSMVAKDPPRRCLVNLGRLQRARAGGTDKDHLVITTRPR